MDRYKQDWINRIFDETRAKEGGIVRRSIATVKKAGSEELLVEAVKARKFHLVLTETDYLIFCNSGLMKILV
jgi:hypothetical protein